MSQNYIPAYPENPGQNLKLFFFKNQTNYINFLLIAILLYFIPLQAADNSWIEEGIDLTINNNFDQAIRLFEGELDKRKDDYRVYFYLAAAYNSRMVHFENWEDQDNFQNAIDHTIEIVKKYLNATGHITDSLRADLLFYLGSAYGYQAYFEGQIGKWFPALSHGIKSTKLLNEAIEADSSLYDAYLGIGTYKYWRYSKLNFIAWLPFIPDDREEGIEMIKKAVMKSRYSKYLAMHQLVYILLDFSRMEEAVQYAEKLVQKYPDSQFMWSALAHAYFKSDIYEQAEKAYLKLMQLIENDENKNPSHLLNCKLKLALIYKRMENNYACQKQCQELILFAQNLALTDKDEERLDQAHKLLEECDSGLK
jgi:tetratricopeptide (TPR) repeat protein